MLARMPTGLIPVLWGVVVFAMLVVVRATFDAVKETKRLARSAKAASKRIAEAQRTLQTEQAETHRLLARRSRGVSSGS